MGWRDINMSRRKPPLRLAVVPVEPGVDRRTAVLRKAAAMAVEVWSEQVDGTVPDGFAPFVAGYSLGYARHVALKHDIDCEAEMAAHAMDELVAAIARGISARWLKIGIARRDDFSRRDVQVTQAADAAQAALRRVRKACGCGLHHRASRSALRFAQAGADARSFARSRAIRAHETSLPIAISRPTRCRPACRRRASV